MLDLPFVTETFDVVIEKGSLDVLFVDNDNAFDPKAQVKARAFQMLQETHRCLPSLNMHDALEYVISPL